MADECTIRGTTFILKTLEERKAGESWSLLYYGPSKSGKTYFAGTAGPRSLFLNLGDGMETLKAPAFTSRYPASSGMLFVDIQEDNVTAAFDKVTRVIDFMMAEKGDLFDTIILDEATALRRVALNKGSTLNTKSSTTQRSQRPNRKEEFIKIEIDDYKIEMDMIEWFLGEYTDRFKKAHKNFLMLAHERQIFGKPPKIGEEAPLLKTVPGFTGKSFPNTVPAFFDDVWKAECVGKVNLTYRAVTAGDEKQTIGSRHGGIFSLHENDPNYLSMLNRIHNNIPATR